MTSITPRRRLAIAVALIGALACASVPLKQRLTLGVQTAHTAVAGAQDIERALYTTQAVVVTRETHARFAAFFVRYFSAEQKVATGLLAWRAGDPAPSDLADALQVLRETVAVAETLTAGADRESLLGKLHAGIIELTRVLDALKGPTP